MIDSWGTVFSVDMLIMVNKGLSYLSWLPGTVVCARRFPGDSSMTTVDAASTWTITDGAVTTSTRTSPTCRTCIMSAPQMYVL